MTNSKKKFLALFLYVVLLIISIPVYAESGTDNSDEHVFTFEELAGMDSPQNPCCLTTEHLSLLIRSKGKLRGLPGQEPQQVQQLSTILLKRLTDIF